MLLQRRQNKKHLGWKFTQYPFAYPTMKNGAPLTSFYMNVCSPWYFSFQSFKEQDLWLPDISFPQKEFDGNNQEEFMKQEAGAKVVVFFFQKAIQ